MCAVMAMGKSPKGIASQAIIESQQKKINKPRSKNAAAIFLEDKRTTQGEANSTEDMLEI